MLVVIKMQKEKWVIMRLKKQNKTKHTEYIRNLNQKYSNLIQTTILRQITPLKLITYEHMYLKITSSKKSGGVMTAF